MRRQKKLLSGREFCENNAAGREWISLHTVDIYLLDFSEIMYERFSRNSGRQYLSRER
jgi:hypothetical protein